MQRLAAFLLVCTLALPAVAQSPLARLDGDHITLLSPIAFVHGTNDVTPEGAAVLDEVVRILRLHPDIRIDIGVHTDSRGTDAYNRSVTNDQAHAIETYLVRHGIPAARIHAEGFGESVPIDSNATEAGRARNRRIEIRVR